MGKLSSWRWRMSRRTDAAIAASLFSRAPCPTKAEQLHRHAANGYDGRFVEEKWNARLFHAAFELRTVLDQVMITFDQVNTGAAFHRSHQIKTMVEVSESIVDQVTGEQDEIGTELVNDSNHLAQDAAGRKPPYMHIADLGDS